MRIFEFFFSTLNLAGFWGHWVFLICQLHTIPYTHSEKVHEIVLYISNIRKLINIIKPITLSTCSNLIHFNALHLSNRFECLHLHTFVGRSSFADRVHLGNHFHNTILFAAHVPKTKTLCRKPNSRDAKLRSLCNWSFYLLSQNVRFFVLIRAYLSYQQQSRRHQWLVTHCHK